MPKARTARVARKTKETDIAVNADGRRHRPATVDTGVPFLDHMLDAFARHGFFDLSVKGARRPGGRPAPHRRGRRPRPRPGVQGRARRQGRHPPLRRGRLSARRGAGARSPSTSAAARSWSTTSTSSAPASASSTPSWCTTSSSPWSTRLGMNLHVDMVPRPQRPPHHRSHLQSLRPRPGRRHPASTRASAACCRPRDPSREKNLTRRDGETELRRASISATLRCSVSPCEEILRLTMIAIIDYGMGNLRSVQKGFERVGRGGDGDARRGARSRGAAGVVLPGVGAFGACMENLRTYGLVDAVRRVVERGTPFLGICLGMQLLFEESEEFGPVRGPRHPARAGGALPRARRSGLQGSAHGLEPDPRAPGRAGACAASPTAPRSTSSTPTTSCRPIPALIADDHRLRRRVRLGDRARQRLRLAVPPGEEPGDRPADAGELRPHRHGGATPRRSRHADHPRHRPEGRACVRLLRGDIARRDRLRRRSGGDGAALGRAEGARICTSSTSTAR